MIEDGSLVERARSRKTIVAHEHGFQCRCPPRLRETVRCCICPAFVVARIRFFGPHDAIGFCQGSDLPTKARYVRVETRPASSAPIWTYRPLTILYLADRSSVLAQQNRSNCERRLYVHGATLSARQLSPPSAKVDERTMTTVESIGRENRFHMDRLYRSYIGLGLAPQNEGGSQTIPVAHFGTFEVRLIEFSDPRRRDSSELWIELYRHDTQSSIDSCRCMDLDEAESLGECLISQARKLCQSGGA